ncbi:predicted protein [Nematostella vectensis]|uniref:Uncharacterized protein n=1 Tax=Nematostella vectensis TaxID=45351 RepID=A7RR05_NEMVE|nr:predicted protein [Nematostella vectensis]|eukprot:XP_001638146.1 predicted protein [Nematostella vectensis]
MTTTAGNFVEIFTSHSELELPVQAKITGQIPPWLSGTLIRNGPGKFEFGEFEYNHIFDGPALLYRFTIDNGKVEYFNKFLRSKSFLENTKANRITHMEYGTNAVPDPCKSIFHRYFSYYFGSDKEKITDNCLVNVIELKKRFYAVSELPVLWQIDSQSLDVIGKVDVSTDMDDPLDNSLAHPHEEPDGTVYNYGIKRGRFTKYNIYKVPPRSKESPLEKTMAGAQVICSLSPTKAEAYVHSFGMSESYFILLENPFFFSIPRFLARSFFGWTLDKCFYWDPTQLSRIHVLCRKTGKELAVFTTDPMFVFHHINAFEKNGEIILDVVAYPDGDIMNGLLIQDMRDFCNKKGRTEHQIPAGQFRRYHLPNPAERGRSTSSEEPHHIFNFEVLYDKMELPRINYEHCNTKEYTYVYGLTNTSSSLLYDEIVKINTFSKEVKTWRFPNHFPSEPVFVPKPGGVREDEGVVLSMVIDTANGNTYLLVLDAQTFDELGRATVPEIGASTIHGRFVKN